MAEHEILVDMKDGDQILSLTKEMFPSLEVSVYTRPAVSLEILRASVEVFHMFSKPKERWLVDTEKFTDAHFSLFLKVLESPSPGGAVWFFNRPLSMYPFTIRSRCRIGGHVDVWGLSAQQKRILEENGLKGYEDEIKKLRWYDFEIAMRMVKEKDSFLAFLFSLETAGMSSWYVIQHRIQDMVHAHVFLFEEWLKKNSIFSKRELGICDFLRSSLFLRRMRAFLFTGGRELEQFVFPFMFCYKVINS